MNPAPRPPTVSVRDFLSWPASWVAWLIFAAVGVVYAPALNGALLWDDPGHLTAPGLRSLGGLARIWFEPGATQQYYPLLHSAFWLEHQLWGDATLPYHVVNVLLHATAACLFGVLLRRLQIPGANLGALLFALHPVCVESVAWISEQKNTLSTVFYLCAALAYLRFQDSRRTRDYVIGAAWFAAALLTKTVTATLPAALLVVAWWRGGRLSWRADVRSLLPWMAAGVVAGLFTAWVERTQIGAHGADFTLDAVQRGLLAGRIVWFYLGKLVWPANLTFIYPRWSIDASAAWQLVFPLAAVAAIAGTWSMRARSRAPLAAILLFGGTLFPVLGFVNVFPFVYSFVADHFQYLASLAAFATAGALVARLRFSPRTLVSAALPLALAIMSWAQSREYRDVFALYEATLARNPSCWMAHTNLATALADAGRLDEAIAHTQQALALRPHYAEAENNLGHQLTRAGRAAEAVSHLERALSLQPHFAEAHNNLGTALMLLGRSDAGIAQFAEAVRLKPDYPLAHYNLGLARARSGHGAEALENFRTALRLQPDYADAEVGLGLALASLNRFSEAMPHLSRAVELAPDSADIHASFGSALAAAGQVSRAVDEFKHVVELDPRSANAHLMLANLLRQLGRHDEAASHVDTARVLGARVN